MNKSESIAKLAEALSKAQGEMHGASKSGVNPHYKSSYSDLADVWAACREPLTKHGLSVVQLPCEQGGVLGVETMLLHSSGEWIGEFLPMPPTKADPQGVGSAITYARRYALLGAAGIASEDDDGNAASGKAAKEVRANKERESTVIGAEHVPTPFADIPPVNPTLKALLQSIKTQELPEKDYAFVTDMRERHTKYGERTKVSDKQMAWLKRLAEKSNDLPPVEAYEHDRISEADIPF